MIDGSHIKVAATIFLVPSIMEIHKPTPQWIEGEGPRERLLQMGPNSLTNAELLAILLRSSAKGDSVAALAQRLLKTFHSLEGIAAASIEQLTQIHGIGETKAVELKAVFELGRRLVTNPTKRPQISCPADAANLLLPEMQELAHEQLRVLLLDTRNRVLKTVVLYNGTINSSVVRIAELFREAIRTNSAGIILAHNHPSGDPSPSAEDVQVTRQTAEAGKLLNITLHDHLIIGRNRFVSMKERGLGF